VPKLLRISSFAKAGLNSDLLPWDLNENYLTDLINVRIARENVAPFGGSALWATMPVNFVPGHIMFVSSDPNDYWLIPGKDAVYVYDGTAFSNISAVAGYGDVNNEDLWHGCFLANIPVINNPGHGPEYWPQQNAGVPLLSLPWDATNTWADVNEDVKIMRSHKQFLFGLDVTSNGENFIDAVRWSSPADIGGLPETWDELDTTQTAGLTNLGGAGGRIVDGLSLRDAFVVYRERSISVFDYVGGQFVWQIRHVSTTVGLISPNAIAEVKGIHYFIGDGDILMYDGTSIESLLHNKLRVRFTSNYSTENFVNSYVVQSNIHSEVWFCIPSSSAIYPDLAYIYNWKDQTWSIREIPEAPFADAGPLVAGVTTWDTIDITWNESVGNWDRESITPLNDTIMSITKPAGVGQSGKLLILDKLNIVSETPYNTKLERVGLALDGLDKVTTITRVYPHIKGSVPVNIQLGSQDHPSSPIRWKPAVSFNPDTDRKLDIRTTGELHCFRFFNDIVEGLWQLSGVDVEYVEAGVR